MKCKNCRYLLHINTETTNTYECELFGEETPIEFDNKNFDGCNLKLSEAKKLKKLNDECIEHSCCLDCEAKALYDERYEFTEQDLKDIEERNKNFDKSSKAFQKYYALLEQRVKERNEKEV